MGVVQTVLPFKLAATEEILTAQGGLALFGEYLQAMGVCGLIDHELPRPGSAVGYCPSAHVLPLLLMLAGGGRTLEDLRVLRNDEGLRTLLDLDAMPSSDATGDWLRRMGVDEAGGLAGLARVHRGVFRRLLRRDERADYTLDIDATQIVAEKREAQTTYKGERGYMPMVGHIAELGVVAGYEFREGNAAPAARNLEFLQACARNLPKGKKITMVRADSAAYQAAIFNDCEASSKVFAIGADQAAAVRATIAGIPERHQSPERPRPRGGEGDDCRYSRAGVEEIPRWRDCRDGALHEQARPGVSLNRNAPLAGTGLVRKPAALSLSCHRQQSRQRGRRSHDGVVLPTRRRQREPLQGTQDRLRHGTHAVRHVVGQCGVLRHRRADL